MILLILMLMIIPGVICVLIIKLFEKTKIVKTLVSILLGVVVGLGLHNMIISVGLNFANYGYFFMLFLTLIIILIFISYRQIKFKMLRSGIVGCFAAAIVFYISWLIMPYSFGTFPLSTSVHSSYRSEQIITNLNFSNEDAVRDFLKTKYNLDTEEIKGLKMSVKTVMLRDFFEVDLFFIEENFIRVILREDGIILELKYTKSI